jgi:flagellar FliL protein
MATSKSNPSPQRTAQNASPKGTSRLKLTLFAVLVALLVAGASAAATWVIVGRSQTGSNITTHPNTGASAETLPNPPKKGAPSFVPIKAFTVTLRGDDMERLLHAAITLRVSSDEERARIEKFMPVVRSRSLMILSAQSPQSVQTKKNKIDIANALMNSLNEPFPHQTESQSITDVLFTEFVVQ